MNAALSGRPDKRHRRTKAAIEQLEAQIYAVLHEDHPQSVRHVFYRMTDPRLPESVEKSERGYCQVQHRITCMRRAGSLPYGWITDATRRGYHTTTFGDSGEFLEAMTAAHLRDLLRESIEQFLPAHALEVTKAAEASERMGLHRLGSLLRDNSLSSVLEVLEA